MRKKTSSFDRLTSRRVQQLTKLAALEEPARLALYAWIAQVCRRFLPIEVAGVRRQERGNSPKGT